MDAIPATTTILSSPLPKLPDNDVLTPSQWDILLAIADTFVPSIVGDATPGKSQLNVPSDQYAEAKRTLDSRKAPEFSQDVDAYLRERASELPAFKTSLRRTLGPYLYDEARRKVLLVLDVLNTRPGSMLLTGSITPIHQQSIAKRQDIIIGWSQSYLPPIRQLYRTFSLLFRRTWAALSPTMPKMIGFPEVPKHGKRQHGYEFEFLQFKLADEIQTLDTDIVIVGSGCGGGVCAKVLSEAGLRVLVVDKSYHYPSNHFPMDANNANIQLMENGGAVLSDDGSMAVFAGSTWGGGGTVNWSASLQTPSIVRQEWANSGLPFFTSAEFQNSLDRVCHRMGVSTKYIEHNFGNRMLMEGSRRLGYSASDVPQNTANQAHYCGYCTYGCAGSVKQGPANSFLPDAARAGATFVEGFEAEEILFKEPAAKKTARGVVGTWTSRDRNIQQRITINAKKVIVSSGTLHSPVLLLRSGLKNYHIGRNLKLHPSINLTSIFDEETRPWEGGVLTSVVHDLENRDGQGHGARLEIMTFMPTWAATTVPWNNGLDFKLRAAQLHHAVGIVVIARDRDSGQVYCDPKEPGRPRLAYTPGQFDRESICEGVIAACKIAYAAGAREIWAPDPSTRRFVRTDENSQDGVNDPSFQSWLDEVRKKGINSPDPSTIGSAHQMGSCRMSSSAKTGVVDPKGKVWGTEGLYVVDASIFPSASGVNPMVTNMGIADWISRGIAKEMVTDDEKPMLSSRL
ncbi:MAG: hypothetical protein Q9227_003949 [Pyrenula ochraceoflavens]